jgi:Flp pilus assembly protein TadD
MVIELRARGPSEPLVRRDGYALLNPLLYRPGTLRPTEAAAALAESERAMPQTPSWIARVMRIDALIAFGREAEACDEEARILKDAPPLSHIYNDLGLLRLGLGDNQKAAARFRWALELNPDSPIARDGLRRAGAAP